MLYGGVMKKICVIDGQGGGLGVSLIRSLREFYGQEIEIIALGTNALATAQMIKAGANKGASGENAVVQNVLQADCILGPLAITWANAMLGEVTAKMAEAVTSSLAPKLLLPVFQESIELVGLSKDPLPKLVKTLVQENLQQVVGPLIGDRKTAFAPLCL